MNPGVRTGLMLGAALLCIALVACMGFFQFRSRAGDAIDMVRSLELGRTGTTVGDGILDYLKDSGIEVVSEGFKPAWGAEQVGNNRWIVNFTFEEGRQATWASWTVDTRSGKIAPRNDLARGVQRGSR